MINEIKDDTNWYDTQRTQWAQSQGNKTPTLPTGMSEFMYKLTSPIWMCVSSTDCAYAWMISFMWRMWLSSMSWNFCKTERWGVMETQCNESPGRWKSNWLHAEKSASLNRHKNKVGNVDVFWAFHFLCVLVVYCLNTHTHTLCSWNT